MSIGWEQAHPHLYYDEQTGQYTGGNKSNWSLWTKWDDFTATHHSRARTCTVANCNGGNPAKEYDYSPHDWVYGSWTPNGGYGCKRTKQCHTENCSTVGDDDTKSHRWGTTTYGRYSTGHTYKNTCLDCGYSRESTIEPHNSNTVGPWFDGIGHCSRNTSCSVCGQAMAEEKLAHIPVTVGSWVTYSGTQHRKSQNCSRCGAVGVGYVYESHYAYSTSVWVDSTEFRHRRTVNCICGQALADETELHTFGAWSAYVNNGDGTKTRTRDCTKCTRTESETVPITALTPWSWTSNVSQGGNMNVVSIGGVNHASPLTATEWNNFTSFVNEVRVAKGHLTYSYATVSPNTNFMAWIFNEAYNQINYMNPPTALPAKPVSGGQILASHINGIKDSVNSLI